jgi:hypothetical protein
VQQAGSQASGRTGNGVAEVMIVDHDSLERDEHRRQHRQQARQQRREGGGRRRRQDARVSQQVEGNHAAARKDVSGVPARRVGGVCGVERG